MVSSRSWQQQFNWVECLKTGPHSDCNTFFQKFCCETTVSISLASVRENDTLFFRPYTNIRVWLDTLGREPSLRPLIWKSCKSFQSNVAVSVRLALQIKFNILYESLITYFVWKNFDEVFSCDNVCRNIQKNYKSANLFTLKTYELTLSLTVG